MYNCIKNYCENNEENGLFLLDMPTGYGKTYNVIKYIYDSSLDPKNKGRKIFFITTMKKNLPIKELKTLFCLIFKQTNQKIKKRLLFLNFHDNIHTSKAWRGSRAVKGSRL